LPERHLELLDLFGGWGGDRERVDALHAAVIGAAAMLDELRERGAGVLERRAILSQTLGEIDAVRPQPGELEQLDRERAILRSAGQMAELLDEVVALSYEGEPTAGSMAATAASKAEQLAELDPSLAELARRLREAALELQDLGASFRDYRERADFDPARLERIEERRAALTGLLLRHGEDEEGLLRLRDATERELDSLSRLDGELEAATEALREQEHAYADAAAKLSKQRRAAAKRLSRAVEGELSQLALEKARFDLRFAPSSETTVEDGRGARIPLHSRGAERAEFLLAANPGEAFRPLRQVASGGELSRIMLALHGIAERASSGRVLVFDEVDAGVSGAVADAVGVRLAGLAARQQVLCVTHLAQVAAHGREHFRVAKATDGSRTSASVVRLSRKDRVDELARMVAGKRPTAASRKHAAELIESAGGRSLGRRRRGA
jgi:DNA repair protein RecN (Recombination protein N)